MTLLSLTMVSIGIAASPVAVANVAVPVVFVGSGLGVVCPSVMSLVRGSSSQLDRVRDRVSFARWLH